MSLEQFEHLAVPFVLGVPPLLCLNQMSPIVLCFGCFFVTVPIGMGRSVQEELGEAHQFKPAVSWANQA